MVVCGGGVEGDGGKLVSRRIHCIYQRPQCIILLRDKEQASVQVSSGGLKTYRNIHTPLKRVYVGWRYTGFIFSLLTSVFLKISEVNIYYYCTKKKI